MSIFTLIMIILFAVSFGLLIKSLFKIRSLKHDILIHSQRNKELSSEISNLQISFKINSNELNQALFDRNKYESFLLKMFKDSGFLYQGKDVKLMVSKGRYGSMSSEEKKEFFSEAMDWFFGDHPEDDKPRKLNYTGRI